MAVYEGKWDCKSCGHKGNNGPDKQCVNCGWSRDNTVEFYLTDETVVSDENKINQANLGADWRCDFCGTENSANLTICKSCNNPKTHDDISRVEKDYNPLENQPIINSKNAYKKEESWLKSKKKTLYWIAGIFSFLAIILIYLWPVNLKTKIIGFSWERTIFIENFREVKESDWQVPSEGKKLNSYQAIHHYNKVFDHYETRSRSVKYKSGTERYKCGKTNKGNGYFSDKYCTRDKYSTRNENYQVSIYRDVPEYRTKYDYMIWRWVVDHPEVTHNNDQKPIWADSTKWIKENWRIGAKKEEYRVHFKYNDLEKAEKVNLMFWTNKNLNDELKLKVGFGSGQYFGLAEENFK